VARPCRARLDVAGARLRVGFPALTCAYADAGTGSSLVSAGRATTQGRARSPDAGESGAMAGLEPDVPVWANAIAQFAVAEPDRGDYSVVNAIRRPRRFLSCEWVIHLTQVARQGRSPRGSDRRVGRWPRPARSNATVVDRRTQPLQPGGAFTPGSALTKGVRGDAGRSSVGVGGRVRRAMPVAVAEDRCKRNCAWAARTDRVVSG